MQYIKKTKSNKIRKFQVKNIKLEGLFFCQQCELSFYEQATC